MALPMPAPEHTGRSDRTAFGRQGIAPDGVPTAAPVQSTGYSHSQVANVKTVNQYNQQQARDSMKRLKTGSFSYARITRQDSKNLQKEHLISIKVTFAFTTGPPTYLYDRLIYSKYFC